MRSFGCDPKIKEELKAHSFLCSGNVQIVHLILPNFCPATFSSAADSAIVLQQLNVKMIFLAKNALKKKRIGTAIRPKINYVHEFSTALWSTHPMVSHGDALLQFNLCDRSILQQAQCSRRDSGVFGFKQHKENL